MYDSAIHESAHAVVGHAMGLQVRDAHVWPERGGMVRFVEDGDQDPEPTPRSAVDVDALRARIEALDREQFLEGLRAMVGGAWAVTARVATIVAPRYALGLARAPATGLESDELAVRVLLELLPPAERAEALATAHRIAEGVVRQRFEDIALVAGHLAVRGRLTGEDVDRVLAERARRNVEPEHVRRCDVLGDETPRDEGVTPTRRRYKVPLPGRYQVAY